MPDTWINQLVVSGPIDEVRRFESMVAAGKGSSTTSLSFVRLQMHLTEDQRRGLDPPVEGWSDDSPDGISPPEMQTRAETGLMDLRYSFTQARYEPDELLIRASTLFPHVCFVFGWVAPSVDEAASRFIHNGHVLLYRASDKRRESLRARAYRRHGLSVDAEDDPSADDSEQFWADIEGDWALLDAVVKHWDGKVARTLQRVQEPSSTG